MPTDVAASSGQCASRSVADAPSAYEIFQATDGEPQPFFLDSGLGPDEGLEAILELFVGAALLEDRRLELSGELR